MNPVAFSDPGGSPARPPRFGPGADGTAEHQTPARVLIVEDNWLIAVEMEDSLVGAGYIVLGIAVCADEAIEACEKEAPDLVLMDIRLLGPRDGVDTAIEIRERFDIGCVFVSAHSDADARARAARARPLGWIVKPVTSGQLVRTLEDLGGNPAH